MFGDMFRQSHGFVTMPVTSRIKDTCSNLYLQSNNYLWHTPHGIIPPATPKNNKNYYLLYEQPSLVKLLLMSIHLFYCCKRLLGRNNTLTISAPHQVFRHLLRGALPLTTAYGIALSRNILHSCIILCSLSHYLCAPTKTIHCVSTLRIFYCRNGVLGTFTIGNT